MKAVEEWEKKIKEKIAKYRNLTKNALKEIRIAELNEKQKKLASEFIDFAKRYFEDAKYFEEKGLLLESLAALSYAHAWLDAGIKAGLLEGRNPKLFAGLEE